MIEKMKSKRWLGKLQARNIDAISSSHENLSIKESLEILHPDQLFSS